jgi:hypothetical protein
MAFVLLVALLRTLHLRVPQKLKIQMQTMNENLSSEKKTKLNLLACFVSSFGDFFFHICLTHNKNIREDQYGLLRLLNRYTLLVYGFFVCVLGITSSTVQSGR